MGIAKPQPEVSSGEITPGPHVSGERSPLRVIQIGPFQLIQARPLREFKIPALRRIQVEPLRMIQIALGLGWLADGLLQFQPFMFSPDFLQVMAGNAQGQPGMVHQAILGLVALAVSARVFFNACFALVQVAIGLGLIVSRRTVKPALVLSFGWTLVVWWAGEGLGMLFTGKASPLTGAPGAVLLYALIGLLVWPAARVPGTTASPAAVRDLAGRVAWGFLWLLLAGLMLLPANSAPDAMSGVFSAAASSMRAGPLAALNSALAALTAGHGLLASVIAAGIMAEVGVMVLVDWHRKVALVAGAAIGVFIFLTSEFLGGILTGQGTDPNSGPLLVLLAALLWVGPLSSTPRLPFRWLPAPASRELRQVHHA